MGKAILFGDIKDKNSDISVALGNHNIKALKPELATKPSVFYVFRGDTGNAPLKDHKITIRHSISRTMAQKVREEPESRANLVYTSDAMCPSECGISVLVEDGVAKKIYGNPHTLVNNGTLCAKGASGLQLTYSPHRIKNPLIRIGRRGEEKWKEISWDEAIDHIAGKLIEIKRKYGPE